MTIALTLLDPERQNSLQRWQFEHETVIRIGRSPDNDIVLNHSLVSRHHLELRQTENRGVSRWQLSNLGTNGSFLNGVLVSKALVLDGASIQLANGGPLLKFQVCETSLAQPSLQIAVPPTLKSSCTHSGNPSDNLFCIHCGQPLRVERVINQYCVLRTLGRGGMGTTYLAWNQQQAEAQRLENLSVGTSRTSLLVLKEMNADMSRIAKARELFEREARTLKSLNHPGIPRFFDFFVENDKKYLAMEVVHGENLETLIFQRGPRTPQQAIEWMIQTCEVLDYLHTRSPPIIHRDIKPANLLLRHSNQRIAVIDFGAVKEIGTPAGTRIGAEGYSAPEQNLGRPVTQSDLYAIGPTLVFLLTCDLPNKFYRKHNRSYRLDLQGIPTISPQLRSVIERVTEPLHRDRYQTARELAEALAACLD